ncbi:ubiquinone biosynthesis protein COQ9-B, mitochondrial [Ricinus communis]|uniref:Ubiquinone biosynthesis protein n=1 Tax=Ricinus communis TaxID=3988 RepID=B9RR78_RICCO|nr:ubiquinone biosynthesis protein COQ9-B, mitochondrial [Ricinus communis]EEF46249.1 Ubiquinone biosynthesis protein COQ9, mitochondrial precursor, putative [Ricinus communis]|eukprot:XP_002516247.1 ubiquinone biosynthesis protein COQ9-B, mitochondrial [Ricinus communis]
MYRTAARRLLFGVTTGKYINTRHRFINLQTIGTGNRFFTSVDNPQSSSNRNPNYQNQNQNRSLNVDPAPNQPDLSASSSTSSTASEDTRHDHHYHRENRRPRVDYQDEQVRVLEASLRHVLRFGWSEEAMIAGARDAGVSPAIVGSFPRKEAALVEFFMDDCFQKLINRVDSGEELQNLVPSERVAKLVRIRLEMQAPYISKWPQALSIQAHPSNLPTSFKQRAMLLDEIWHAAGAEGSDIDWYVKRTVLGGIYSTTEVYMLTDSSPDFRDTWAFLDNRVKDAFDFKKTIQEAKYFAEAVGAGMGNSVQGFMKKVFQG